MLKFISVAGFIAFFVTLCPVNANDSLVIPDTDEGVPGADHCAVRTGSAAFGASEEALG